MIGDPAWVGRSVLADVEIGTMMSGPVACHLQIGVACASAFLVGVSGANVVALGWRDDTREAGTPHDDGDGTRWITRLAVPTERGTFAFTIRDDAAEFLGPASVTGDGSASVSDLRAIESTAPTDDVVVVEGWLVRAAPAPCPAPRELFETPVPALEFYCSGSWLTPREELAGTSDNGPIRLEFADGIQVQSGAYGDFAPAPDQDATGSIPRLGVYLVRNAGCPPVTMSACPVWRMVGRLDIDAQPSPSPSPDASVVVVPTAPPDPAGPTPACMASYAIGRLVEHGEWGIAVVVDGATESKQVIWPHGYSGLWIDSRLALLDERGQQVAYVGDHVQLNGGWLAGDAAFTNCGGVIVVTADPTAAPSPSSSTSSTRPPPTPDTGWIRLHSASDAQLRWAPDSHHLLYRTDDATPTVAVLDEHGVVVQTFPGFADGEWLDGNRFLGYGSSIAGRPREAALVTIGSTDLVPFEAPDGYSLGNGHGAIAFLTFGPMRNDIEQPEFKVWTEDGVSDRIDGYPFAWSLDGTKLALLHPNAPTRGMEGWLEVLEWPSLRSVYNDPLREQMGDQSIRFDPTGRYVAEPRIIGERSPFQYAITVTDLETGSATDIPVNEGTDFEWNAASQMVTNDLDSLDTYEVNGQLLSTAASPGRAYFASPDGSTALYFTAGVGEVPTEFTIVRGVSSWTLPVPGVQDGDPRPSLSPDGSAMVAYAAVRPVDRVYDAPFWHSLAVPVAPPPTPTPNEVDPVAFWRNASSFLVDGTAFSSLYSATAQSHAIILGHLVGVESGDRLEFGKGDSVTTHEPFVVVAIDEVLNGAPPMKPDGTVDVVGVVGAGMTAADLPDGQFIIFLVNDAQRRSETGWPSSQLPDDEFHYERPNGYQCVLPIIDGLIDVIEGPTGWRDVLGPYPSEFDGLPVDQVIEQIRAVADGGP